MKNNFLKKTRGLLVSKFLIVALVLILILEGYIFSSVDSNFHIYFLDVGQGDSILIRTPGYKYILVDGGEDESVVNELGEVLPFWQKRIDVIVGTHGDSDHIGGLIPVFEKYDVSSFVYGDFSEKNVTLQSLVGIANGEDISLYEAQSGDMISIEDTKISILWPEENFTAQNDNQKSIVIDGEYGKFKFFLTGDIEESQERRILSQNDGLTTTVLKASHHGSKTATGEEILETLSPESMVISCGLDNQYGHPHKEVIDRIDSLGIEYQRTDLSGRVEYVSDGERYWLRCENGCDK